MLHFFASPPAGARIGFVGRLGTLIAYFLIDDRQLD